MTHLAWETEPHLHNAKPHCSGFWIINVDLFELRITKCLCKRSCVRSPLAFSHLFNDIKCLITERSEKKTQRYSRLQTSKFKLVNFMRLMKLKAEQLDKSGVFVTLYMVGHVKFFFYSSVKIKNAFIHCRVNQHVRKTKYNKMYCNTQCKNG